MMLVDKYPLNTVHVPLILRLFPDARFIFSLRHPCDVCLSCFMQEFGRVPVYANFTRLQDTTEVYAKIMRLWKLYTTRWQFPVHYLRYEELVGAPRETLESLLGFLGLDWADELGDHTKHATRRGRIYTPSYHQVSRPLFSSSIGRWLKYRTFLEPFIAKLEIYANEFEYSFENSTQHLRQH